MKLIYLERKGYTPHETEAEIHVDEINQTNNLLLTTKDLQLAKDIVRSYNKFKDEQRQYIVDLMNE
jgi:hypothetical protein